jgi:hypothetical protein
LSEPLFEVKLTSQEKQATEELLGTAILNLAYQCDHHHHHSVQLSNTHLSWEEILTLETQFWKNSVTSCGPLFW